MSPPLDPSARVVVAPSAEASRRAAALRAVLFDKDGTLFDFHASWGPLGGELIAELSGGDAARAAAMAEIAGFDLDAGRYRPGSPIAAGEIAPVVAGWAELLGPDRPERGRPMALAALVMECARRVAASGLSPAVDDLPGFLDRLAARGLTLGVATNDRAEAARAQLEQVGALDRFAALYGADDGFGAKPEPGMLHAFCAAVDLPSTAVAMVGDTREDLAMARAGGAGLAVAVLTGPATCAELAPAADVVLTSIAALPALLADAAASALESPASP